MVTLRLAAVTLELQPLWYSNKLVLQALGAAAAPSAAQLLAS